MKPKLNRHVFLALATVAWADGNLAPEEREGILQAAERAGFSAEERAALDAAIQQPRDIDSLKLANLSATDRVLVYAIAMWLARLDGVVEEGEQVALDKLGDKLMLSERVRTAAAATAEEVAQLPTGDRPDRYDIVKLRSIIEDRVFKRG